MATYESISTGNQNFFVINIQPCAVFFHMPSLDVWFKNTIPSIYACKGVNFSRSFPFRVELLFMKQKYESPLPYLLEITSMQTNSLSVTHKESYNSLFCTCLRILTTFFCYLSATTFTSSCSMQKLSISFLSKDA